MAFTQYLGAQQCAMLAPQAVKSYACVPPWWLYSKSHNCEKLAVPLIRRIPQHPTQRQASQPIKKKHQFNDTRKTRR
eukprot:scaffold157200_cov40-Prasinocladus_malaysianus.AAC.1